MIQRKYDIVILQVQIVQLKLLKPKTKEIKCHKTKIYSWKQKTSIIKKISQPKEPIVISNYLDMNTLGGENSKSRWDILELHYSSTYDHFYCAPMNVLIK